MMQRLLFSAYIGLCLFFLLNLFFGRGGLFDIKDVNEYKTYLTANIEELKEINQTLTLELKALSASPETVKLYARDFGYFEKNEQVIKIQGAPEIRQFYRLGSLLRRNSDASAPNPLFHIIGASVALVSFIILSFSRRKQHHADFHF